MGWLKRAIVGISGGRDPHVDTSNRIFSAVYGGMKKSISNMSEGRVYFDCVVLDACEREIQIMYKGKFAAGGEVSPPVCFSDNGLGPSLDAPQPQAPTCQRCEWRKFGTAVSESGKAIPRCTRKKRLVVLPLVLGYDTALQFDLPPACHGNWKGLYRKIVDSRANELNVLIRVFMVENENGFLDFDILGYVDQMIGPEGLALIERRAEQPDVAALARHNDQPIDPQTWRPELAGQVDPITALPAPQASSTFTASAAYAPGATTGYLAAPQAAVTYAPTTLAAPTPVTAYAPQPAYTASTAQYQSHLQPPAQAPAPPTPMAIEPDPAVTPKKRGRPAKAKDPVPEPGPATQTPSAAEVMAGYGMTPAHAVGQELQTRLADALNMKVPPRT